MTQKQTSGVCKYQDCERRIQSWYDLCAPHNDSKRKGEIDECPGCGNYKDAIFPQCRACHASARTNNPRSQQKYEPERNPKWDAADEEGDVFFVYILKLDGGKFYAGHTRELRERMSEHRDGKTKSTAGKNPRLVWFEDVDTREKAAEAEAYLKELIDKNEREVRRMVTEFLDLIREVDTEADRDTQPQTVSNTPMSNGRKTGYRPRRLGYRR